MTKPMKTPRGTARRLYRERCSHWLIDFKAKTATQCSKLADGVVVFAPSAEEALEEALEEAKKQLRQKVERLDGWSVKFAKAD